jgi:deoxycytidylate deaminase
MIIKGRTPKEVCEEILKRSSCSVQVGAVVVDGAGIFGWGWNHMGENGMGEHAEVSCLRRSNHHRQSGSTLFVASVRQRTQKFITSKPCLKCQGWIESRGIKYVWWKGADGLWHPL